jgi:TadE-like protein
MAFLRRKRTRGQAMIEFALILPVLVLLLLLAIDFGRVFFGWVALNNSVRIAASEAGYHPEGWDGGNPLVMAQQQAVYREEVVQDISTINCAPSGGGAWADDDIPDPAFIDMTGTTDPYEVGDHVRVNMSCDFSFLTPLVGIVVGDPLTISAGAEFPVKAGDIAGVPIGSSIPTPTPTPLPTPSPTPSPTPGPSATATPSATPSPTPAQCEVPQLFGLRANDAASVFHGPPYSFTGNLTINRPPNGNYVITGQNLTAGQMFPCTTDITVFGS